MSGRIRRMLIAALAAASLLTTGFVLGNSVIMDPHTDPVYQEASAGEMLSALKENEVRAKTLYDGQYLAVFGTVSSVGGNGRTLELAAEGKNASDGGEAITCHMSSEALRGTAADFAPGDAVLVYGYVRITKIPSASYSMQANGAERSEGAKANPENFRLLNREPVSRQSFLTRSLGQGLTEDEQQALIRIPAAWKQVEEELPELDGYLYRLNELPDAKRTKPEQLYVFWFDNEKYLKNMNDSKRATEIERAIIRNILPKEKIGIGRFPVRREVYGRTWQYYTTGYADYHAEFAFTAPNEDGILCLLYVCETSDHLRDILYLLRFAELP